MSNLPAAFVHFGPTSSELALMSAVDNWAGTLD
jgi:hypothetical protein